MCGSLPGARDGHSACIVGHCMYIFGGFEENIDQFSCDVHCLNLKTMEWRYIQTFGTAPTYRDFHSATVINDRMYIFGGRGDIHSPYHSQEEIYCHKIVYLDLKTNHWHLPITTGKLPVGRRSHSACKLNLYFITIIIIIILIAVYCDLILFCGKSGWYSYM